MTINKPAEGLSSNSAAQLEIERILAEKSLCERNAKVTDTALAEEIEKEKRKRLEIQAFSRKMEIRRRIIATLIIIMTLFFITPPGQALAKMAWEFIVTITNTSIKQEGIEGYQPGYTIEPKEFRAFDNVADASEYIGNIPLHYFDADDISLTEISVVSNEENYLVTSIYLLSENNYIVLHESLFEESAMAKAELEELDGIYLETDLISGVHMFYGKEDDGELYAIGLKNNVLLQVFAEQSDFDDFSGLLSRLVI